MDHQYSLLNLISDGATATVYNATHKRTKKNVAVKIIKFRKNLQEQFLREKSLLKKISHPYIVKLFDSFSNEKFGYLVLQRGEINLSQFVYQKFNENREKVLKIIRMILLGVEYLHSMKIVHRDLKLSNIVLTKKSILICDFGLSTYENSDMRSFCGTEDYLAPEMRRREPYDRKVDLYSAGLIFHILLTGKKYNGTIEICSEKLFLEKLLCEKDSRYSASDALLDPIFQIYNIQLKNFEQMVDFEKQLKIGDIRKSGHFLYFDNLKVGKEKIFIDNILTEKHLLLFADIKKLKIMQFIINFLWEKVFQETENKNYAFKRYFNGNWKFVNKLDGNIYAKRDGTLYKNNYAHNFIDCQYLDQVLKNFNILTEKSISTFHIKNQSTYLYNSNNKYIYTPDGWLIVEQFKFHFLFKNENVKITASNLKTVEIFFDEHRFSIEIGKYYEKFNRYLKIFIFALESKLIFT